MAADAGIMNDSDPVAHALLAFESRLCEMVRDLPFAELSGAEAKALGGRIFAEGPRFTAALERGVRLERHLFPDVPEEALQALSATQARAAAWRLVADGLVAFGRLAQDSYVAQQASALSQAFAILEHVERRGPTRLSPPEEHARHGERLFALQPAREVLRERLRRRSSAGAAKAAPRPRRPPRASAVTRRLQELSGVTPPR